MNAAARDTNGNGRKLTQYIGSFWYIIAIGGVVVSGIGWGFNLRTTVERNHTTVVKQEAEIEALKIKQAALETMLHGYITPREVIEAMRTGAERNKAQDDRIADLARRLDRLEQSKP